ncbi:MAG TPA: tRNA pseudouridine(38-40) synthase TruA [Terriglobales bacterium]|nr:tRNA pseudouridine(38-40) synthase TruA [Terriglobales bacterium]
MGRNLKLVLSYDGADFSGWQVQPGRPTVQGALAAALERVTGARVLPQGSGRTDAGVHALAQVASCAMKSDSAIPAENLVRALNDLLPPTVRVLSVEDAPPEFHARHSARAKTYRYRIFRGSICPPFLARYVYHHPFPLDEEAICRAAPWVAGEHDFTSFAAVDPEDHVARAPSPAKDRVAQAPSPVKETNVRTIFSSTWERQDDELIYTVRGSGFLHHMVRNLVGTFLLVGKGSLDQAGFRRILDSKNRSAAGSTAPTSGLCLVSVEY